MVAAHRISKISNRRTDDFNARPGLLEHLPTQTWIAFRGWGVNWSQGCCALDLGCGIGGGGGG